MLTSCPALKPDRDRLKLFLMERSLFCPPLHEMIIEIFHSNPHTQTQFLLDPCHIPAVRDLCVNGGPGMLDHVFYLARTFVYYMHRSKMILLGRWPGDPGRKQRNLAKGIIASDFKNPTNTNCLFITSTNNSIIGPIDEPVPTLVPVTSNATDTQYRHMDNADAALCVTIPVSNSPVNCTANTLLCGAKRKREHGGLVPTNGLPCSFLHDLQNSTPGRCTVTGPGSRSIS